MVRCRFAPSPTGFLHIGNVRTAIFNYLFARHNGGQFLLRIEDTDKERSTKEAIDVVFEGLKLLGLEWDGDVVFQSKNAARHTEVANALLESGKAYKCFHTQEELNELRGKNRNVVSKWRNVDAKDHPENTPYVVRLKSPDTGVTSIDDMVQGNVEVKNSELDDMIILRSDGSPVYQLAVVVDDHDSGITHVIRGDDHLTNTFRQNMIYDGMGWDKPTYGHLPLIMDENGKKISKRTGAASIVDFINMGYLPETMLNYLVKLGWSNEQEFMSKEELIAAFDFDKVGASASRLDYKKLKFINAHWINNSDDDKLVEFFFNILPTTEFAGISYDKDVIKEMMPALKVRSKTVVEMMDMTKYLDDNWYENTECVIPEKVNALKDTYIVPQFITLVENFTTNDNLMEGLKQFAEDNGSKLKDVAAYIRFKLCKDKISPPLDVVITSLGIDKIKKRMANG